MRVGIACLKLPPRMVAHAQHATRGRPFVAPGALLDPQRARAPSSPKVHALGEPRVYRGPPPWGAVAD